MEEEVEDTITIVQPYPAHITEPIPEPSQSSTPNTDIKPDPTTDWELMPATMNEPEPTMRTEPTFALEPEPHSEFDVVCEPASTCVIVGLLVEFKGKEEIPAHHPTTEGELLLTSAD